MADPSFRSWIDLSYIDNDKKKIDPVTQTRIWIRADNITQTALFFKIFRSYFFDDSIFYPKYWSDQHKQIQIWKLEED